MWLIHSCFVAWELKEQSMPGTHIHLVNVAYFNPKWLLVFWSSQMFYPKKRLCFHVMVEMDLTVYCSILQCLACQNVSYYIRDLFVLHFLLLDVFLWPWRWTSPQVKVTEGLVRSCPVEHTFDGVICQWAAIDWPCRGHWSSCMRKYLLPSHIARVSQSINSSAAQVDSHSSLPIPLSSLSLWGTILCYLAH